MIDRSSLIAVLNPPSHERTLRLAHLRGRSTKQSEIDRFIGHGIRAIDLGLPWPVLVDRVVFDGEFFYFADDVGMIGELAFTFLVISDAASIDIAAWQPTENRHAVWCGEGFALGERLIHYPNPLVDGLPVFRTPIGWLRAGRCGIVMLRPQFARSVLADVPILVAEDEQHRKELQELFQFTGPQIAVPEPANAEAA